MIISVYSSTNKTDRHDIAEILLKVALNIITPNPSNDNPNVTFPDDEKNIHILYFIPFSSALYSGLSKIYYTAVSF